MSLNKYRIFRENNFPAESSDFANQPKDTQTTIQSFIQKWVTPIAKERKAILNIGARHSCGLPERNIRYLSVERMIHLPSCLNGTYDLIICTANILRQIDPMEAFVRFGNVLNPGGLLVFDFENSNALQLVLNSDFNKKAVFISTSRHEKRQWHYSDSWINELLSLTNFDTIKKHKFRYALPVGNCSSKRDDRRRTLGLDSVLRFVPLIRSLSSSTIVLCQKKHIN
jgi:hypothetical protein